MNEKRKSKFLTKSVRYGTKEVTLYSIDGTTWSTRSNELSAIMERHEMERQKLLQNMGEVKAQEAEEAKVDATKGVASYTKADYDEAPVIISDDAVEVVGEEAEDAQDGKAKIAAKSDIAIAPKAKKSNRQIKGKEKVNFIKPKPRQIAKKKQKAIAGKAKKQAAA